MSGRASSAVLNTHERSAHVGRLAERRRLRRRRIILALFVVVAATLGGLVYGLWQHPVRISRIAIYGADQALADTAAEAMQGRYLGVIPRDSIFFYSEERIRSAILAANPAIAAISIFRNGLSGLSIKVDYRVPIAQWCGLAPVEGVTAYCYVFDANGFIFAAAATTTKTVNNFVLYAPLAGDTQEPLCAMLAHAERFPYMFEFTRRLATFGSPVEKIVLRNDEVDEYLRNGTRITYVLGSEQEAFAALTTAHENLNLADGSLDYVDLRFSGKVYSKKK